MSAGQSVGLVSFASGRACVMVCDGDDDDDEEIELGGEQHRLTVGGFEDAFLTQS